ncbi:MAG: 1-acyl-sn-glycerol-3-phosphate acyltransferase [Sphingobacteriaceae bacterium]|nr:1-acyl-sn-glycerol-3-phosphate acyltransferase [Sphingobacteriaceae bacterium]
MQKILGYLFTPLYLLTFGLSLVVFTPVQWLAFNLLGYQAQQQMVYMMNWCLMRCIHWVGGGVNWRKRDLPLGPNYIFAANHQSMNDIPAMIWFLRKYRSVFIAKQELSKGVPGISYNYKCGGAVGIIRKDPVQAREAIAGLAQRCAKTGEAICIFPEGTRSRDGQLKPFQAGGMKTILQHIPEAVVVPIAIENSWKLVRYKFWPIPFGISLRWTMLEPIACKGLDGEEVTRRVEAAIAGHLTAGRRG